MRLHKVGCAALARRIDEAQLVEVFTIGLSTRRSVCFSNFRVRERHSGRSLDPYGNAASIDVVRSTPLTCISRAVGDDQCLALFEITLTRVSLVSRDHEREYFAPNLGEAARRHILAQTRRVLIDSFRSDSTAKPQFHERRGTFPWAEPFKEYVKKEGALIMKRLATATLAALMFASPIALSTNAAADPPRHHDRGDRGDRDYDNRDDRRDERQAYRQGYRDSNRHDRWERNRHNGYTYQGRWYYGPPPQAYYGAYEPGYHSWRRGDRLPSYYRDNYRSVDYRRHHLRAPPRGYQYVEDDRGELLLVGIATGVILGIIASQ
jgi:Ni/Co efflux regulator RcnB